VVDGKEGKPSSGGGKAEGKLENNSEAPWAIRSVDGETGTIEVSTSGSQGKEDWLWGGGLIRIGRLVTGGRGRLGSEKRPLAGGRWDTQNGEGTRGGVRKRKKKREKKKP